MTCKRCQKTFKPTHLANTSFCSPECAYRSKLDYNKKWNLRAARRRGIPALGSRILCEECERPLVKTSSKRKLHTECNDKRQRASCRRVNRARKIRVLTHYSTKGVLGCSWVGCLISDLDMLCLDHIENDGYVERNSAIRLYARLEKKNLPVGYQTLCYNHNMKKAILFGIQNWL